MSGVVCAVLAGLAVACAVPGPPARAGTLPSRATVLMLFAAVVAGFGWWAADRPRVLVVGLVVLVVAMGASRLVARRRADRAAARERGRVVAACEGMRAELEVGQSPAAALTRTATDWPLLQPVARVAEVGGDVAPALRDAAARPGAEDLRLLAAAWDVAHRTGHGLADAIGRVAAELRAADHTRRIVTGELASARATARLVAALPALALAMGTGAGADPLSFLVGHPVGIACLAAGAGCALAGLAWIEAIARDVERAR